MILSTREGWLFAILFFYAVIFTLLGLVPPTDVTQGSGVELFDGKIYNPVNNEYLTEEENNAQFTWLDGLLVASSFNPITKPYADIVEESKTNRGFFGNVIVNLKSVPPVINAVIFAPLFIIFLLILWSYLPFT